MQLVLKWKITSESVETAAQTKYVERPQREVQDYNDLGREDPDHEGPDHGEGQAGGFIFLQKPYHALMNCDY